MTAPVLDQIKPGVHDIPEADYFAATYALSSSGIKALLPPSCPAKFRYGRREHKPEFDIGSAAHMLVLGSGPGIDVIDAACIAALADRAAKAGDVKAAKLYAETAAKGDPDGWLTSAAKAARDAARAAGRIPVLRKDYEHVTAMADVLRQHPVASVLFDPSAGLPERSLFWADDEFGIDCRARLDWLPDPRGGRLILPDYKTCDDASDEAAMKAVGNWSYHIQHAWYCAGVAACGLDDDPAFLFVFQEKQPPYLINVVQLDAGAIGAGQVACRAAAEIYRDCMAVDVWPGYGPEIATVSLPPWKTRIPEEYYLS